MSPSQTVCPRLPFIVAWEFRVRPGRRRAFEKAYGPGGDWVRLLGRNPGHIRSELIRDRERPLHYLTLDFWNSRRAYECFMKQNHAEYERIDRRCSFLTVEEKLIGKFDAPIVVPEVQSRTGRCAIRPAMSADIPEMRALEKQSPTAAHWPQATYEKIFDCDAPPRLAFTLVAEDGTLQGFVVAALGEECELENIVIAGYRTGQGWGKKLLAAVISAARAHHAKAVFLEVRESAARARGLYEAAGFFAHGRRKGYYHAPVEDAILYRREL